jgi:prepilin-type N-terminal cleavage/methylation domain-containing protein
MSVTRSSFRARAMSLIELLCVMAIIALLAALLLPALMQAKTRALRLQCVNHLHEVGVGFVNFAGDHNGRFPMAVPVSDGGTLELAQGGYRIDGDFYFSFRHFQAASNQLVTPKLVVCPADLRLPATTFSAMSNANLSYFVGVNAQFERPASILAGDRNLTNDYASPGTLIRLGLNYSLRWTEEMHRFKGNLLFADVHVEEKNTPALAPVVGQVPAVANLALPTMRPAGGSASVPTSGSSVGEPVPSTASGVLDGQSPGHSRKTNALTAAAWSTQPATATRVKNVPVQPGGGAVETQPAPPKAAKGTTNAPAPAAPVKPEQETPNRSPFGAWLAAVLDGVTRNGMWWLYALLLLIVVATLVLRRLAHGKTRRPTKPRGEFR